jgi:hypothetical protein
LVIRARVAVTVGPSCCLSGCTAVDGAVICIALK